MLNAYVPSTESISTYDPIYDAMSNRVSIPNMVDHPDHYQSKNGIECIDAVAAATENLSGEEAFCTASAIKYLWRWKKKGKPIEDLNKAKWYIDRIIKKLSEENND